VSVTDEAEVIRDFSGEVLWVELLERQAHVENLAIIIYVTIVAVTPSLAAEGVNNVGPDECGVVRQPVHDGGDGWADVDEAGPLGGVPEQGSHLGIHQQLVALGSGGQEAVGVDAPTEVVGLWGGEAHRHHHT